MSILQFDIFGESQVVQDSGAIAQSSQIEIPQNVKHVVCYSGGHSSAIVAIEVVRRFGKENCVLLNHDIASSKEDPDIKRFKREVAEYLETPITYANILGITDPDRIPDQFDVCMIAKAFKVGSGSELCTNRLKTAPFANWVKENCVFGQAVFYYGFDANEKARVIRRRKAIESMGFLMSAPLAEWKRSDRTIRNTEEIGIARPGTYGTFKHGNCVGCLKAKKQHWYIVFCTRKDVWNKAKKAEAFIGHSIMSEGYLESFEELFDAMQKAGVVPTENVQFQRFWKEAEKAVSAFQSGQGHLLPLMGEDLSRELPCECFV